MPRRNAAIRFFSRLSQCRHATKTSCTTSYKQDPLISRKLSFHLSLRHKLIPSIPPPLILINHHPPASPTSLQSIPASPVTQPPKHEDSYQRRRAGSLQCHLERRLHWRGARSYSRMSPLNLFELVQMLTFPERSSYLRSQRPLPHFSTSHNPYESLLDNLRRHILRHNCCGPLVPGF